MDPKLDFKKHLEVVEKKIATTVNLFKKIKSLKINHIKINTILFKSLVQPIFDYAFIALSCPTQRIMDAAQKIQNRFLRAIKYFPPHSRISDIHSYFKIKSIKSRSYELLMKFTKSKRGHELIAADLAEFQNEIAPRSRKYLTIFDTILRFNS